MKPDSGQGLIREKWECEGAMRTAFLTGVGKFEIRDTPIPGLEHDDDVLLRIHSVGVCGSDAHYFSSAKVGDINVPYPLVLGHECSAIIEETGMRAMKFKKGDRVVVDPAITCGECDQCRAGRPHTCRRVQFLSYPGQLDGCLAEFIVVPEANCFPMPAKMTMSEGALIEPLSIGIYAVDLWKKDQSRGADPRPGAPGAPGDISSKPIAVLGTGPIGLCIILAAGAEKISRIYATDKIDDRTRAAAGAGAHWTGNPDKEDVVKGILEHEPLGLDAVFECCGDQAALDQAVELLKPGGTLFVLGILTDERATFDASALRRKEIRIQSVRRQNQCTAKAIDAVANGLINVRFLATHTFSLGETHRAFETSVTYADGVLKAMVEMPSFEGRSNPSR